LSIIYRGRPGSRPGRNSNNSQAPEWKKLVLALACTAVVVVVIAIPGKPMQEYEYERDGLWCHEKTVCCNSRDESTCTSFESCRRAG